ncbi:MAG TPA: putative lipid II flippase FtsW, partial [Dehalococcoidia bacterium]|nr:putative lipid II flippase FtsW [Dehalococcoidia bacterium]
MTEQRRAGRPDFWLIGVTAALVAVGLSAVYSASFALGYADYHNVNYFIVKQAEAAAIGVVLLFACYALPYGWLRGFSPLIMLCSLVALLAVLLPHIGVRSNGASRWIALGPLPPLEPSEFAKLAMVIYIAAWLAAKGDNIKSISLGVLPFCTMVGLVGGLILLEPDMGTAIVITLTTVTMFFVAGASLKHVLMLFVTGIAAGTPLMIQQGYRSSRMIAFLDPEKDPAGKGFHILQLLIALGSGGIKGLGWGASRQKFFYVPGAHTDGIFAIIGEELGFLGCVFVIGLFAIFVWRGLRASYRAARGQDRFASLLALGITCWIGYEAVINIGGITRSIPMTGVPLPLISYGGTAMMATLAAVGLLINVTRFLPAAEAEGRLPRRRAVTQTARLRRRTGRT